MNIASPPISATDFSRRINVVAGVSARQRAVRPGTTNLAPPQDRSTAAGTDSNGRVRIADESM